jgi:hypothetical protein
MARDLARLSDAVDSFEGQLIGQIWRKHGVVGLFVDTN